MRILRTAALAAVLMLTALGGAAHGRPFSVGDLLSQEAFGASAVDPSGRWLVYERRDRYDSAPRFDYGQSVGLLVSRLRKADVRAPGAPRPLINGDPLGVTLGPFSPSGDRVAVFQLQDQMWRLGVVTVASGEVRWFDVTPREARPGRALQWRDDRTLLVLGRPDRRLPVAVRESTRFTDTLRQAWDRSARGEAAYSVFGSGAYLAVRERSADVRLLSLDVQSGATSILAKGQLIDLELSPDRRRVALLESGPDLQPRPGGPVRGPAGNETEATRLSILDLATGEVRRPCAQCDVLQTLTSWSPSGAQLLLFVRGQDGLWPSGHFLVVDGRTGTARPLGGGVRPALDLNPVSAWTAWMGETPLIFGRVAAGARADWMAVSETGVVNLTERLPPPSKTVRLATRGELRVLAEGALWAVDRRGAKPRRLGPEAVVPLDQGGPALGRRLRAAPPSELWLEQGDAGATAIHVDGAGLRSPGGPWVQRTSDEHDVQTIWLVTNAGRVPVDKVNVGWTKIAPIRTVAVSHRGPAGEPLVSWVFLPEATGRKAPLVVRPYLGANYPRAPVGARERDWFPVNLRTLVGHGYAVLVPSLPDPPGGLVEPAEGLAERILGVVRAAAKTPALEERVDFGRLALIGHSFGGYSVMTAITQTDCFRAAVAMDGISDLTAYWSSLHPVLTIDSVVAYYSNWHTGVVESVQPQLGGPPWQHPERYVRNSPLYAADRIHTPLLLFHGAQDDLPSAQSEAMYSALFRQSKDAIFVTYWGEMHWPVSPGDVRDLYARTFAFLDEHLDADVTPGAAPSESPERGSANGEPKPPPPPPTGCVMGVRSR